MTRSGLTRIGGQSLDDIPNSLPRLATKRSVGGRKNGFEMTHAWKLIVDEDHTLIDTVRSNIAARDCKIVRADNT